MRNFFDAILRKIGKSLLSDTNVKMDRLIAAQGRLSANTFSRLSPIKNLSGSGFQAFSQWDEDGILQWIINRIPDISRSFVEFGVENYREANTRFLLINNNWRGLVIDSNENHISSIHTLEIFWQHDLKAVCSLVTAENINELISGNGFTHDLGILSIDVDGNDYWIWRAIECVSPSIVICEYNAVFGDLIALTIPYNPHFDRTKSHPSNLYFGASIAALKQVAKDKGYVLIGSNNAGNNAFFVRQDLYHCLKNELLDLRPLPSLFREARDQNGDLTFTSGLDRLQSIIHMPVVRLDTNETVKIESLSSQLYSKEWLRQMGTPE